MSSPRPPRPPQPTGPPRPAASPRPPRLAAWLVDRLLPVDDAQRLLGDLDEEYTDFQRSQRGPLRANRVLAPGPGVGVEP